MRRILSERNLVVVLFITALVVFGFAQEDTKKIERIYQGQGTVSSLLPAPKQSATTTLAAKKSPVVSNLFVK